MIDQWLEPDDEALRLEWEFDGDIDMDDAREIQIAQHNYECMIFNEPHLRIVR